MGKSKKKTIIDFTKQKKIVPWVSFENEVAEFFEKSLPTGNWGMAGHSALVRRKPSYYSKDRESDIIFDVSVEVRPPGSSDLLFLWIIECKDYPNRNVEVGEVEEFHRKVGQVGAHKGTVFTRKGFDSGGLTYAKTHRIGLSVLTKEEYVSIALSQSGGAFYRTNVTISFFLDGNDEPHSYLTHLIAATLRPWQILIPPVALAERRITFEEQLQWEPLKEYEG